MKKVLSLLIVMLLLISMIPVNVGAQEGPETTEPESVVTEPAEETAETEAPSHEEGKIWERIYEDMQATPATAQEDGPFLTRIHSLIAHLRDWLTSGSKG